MVVFCIMSHFSIFLFFIIIAIISLPKQIKRLGSGKHFVIIIPLMITLAAFALLSPKRRTFLEHKQEDFLVHEKDRTCAAHHLWYIERSFARSSSFSLTDTVRTCDSHYGRDSDVLARQVHRNSGAVGWFIKNSMSLCQNKLIFSGKDIQRLWQLAVNKLCVTEIG